MLLFALLPAALATPPCPDGSSALTRADARGREEGCLAPDGRFIGPYQRYRLDGSLESSGSMANGLPQGRWTWYHPGGAKAQEGTLDGGNEVGSWTTWDPSGQRLALIEASPLLVEGPAPEAGADGRVRWSLSLPSPVDGELIPAGDLVLVPTRGALVAVEVATGAVAWQAPLRGAPLPGFGSAEGRLVVVTAAGDLTSIDVDAGTVRQLRTGRHPIALAGLWSDRAVVQEETGRLVAIDPDTGEILWKSLDYSSPIPPAALGELVLGARGASIIAWNVHDGSVAWRKSLPARAVELQPGADGRSALVVDSRGGIELLEGASGAPRWTASIDGFDKTETYGLTAREDNNQVVVLGLHTALVLERGSGRLLDRVDLGADRVPVDLFGDHLAQGRPSSLELGRLAPGQVVAAGSLPIQGGLRVPPLLTQGLAIAATGDGHLLAVDLVLAEARSRTGLAASRLDPDEAAALDGLVVWAIPSGEEEAVPLLQPRVLAGRATAEGCTTTALLLDLSATPGLRDARFGFDGLVEERGPSDPPWSIDPAWEAVGTNPEWSLEGWHQWEPRIERAWPVHGEEGLQESLEAVLRCEGEGGELMAVVELTDGIRRRRVEGWLRLDPGPGPTPWGENSCLVHLSAGGESMGWWSPPDQPAWVPWSLRGEGELPPLAEDGLPDAPLPGPLWVGALAQLADAVEERAFDGQEIDVFLGEQERVELWEDGHLSAAWETTGLRMTGEGSRTVWQSSGLGVRADAGQLVPLLSYERCED